MGMRFVKFYREDTGDVLRFAVSFLRAGMMVAVMWAKRRGDRWCREKPGDVPFVWVEKIFFKKVVVRNLYFGRLAMGFGIRRNSRATEGEIRKTFEEELAAVSDPAYREFAVACLKEAPPEFWLYPASTSGKHHPEWARGEGGLQLLKEWLVEKIGPHPRTGVPLEDGEIIAASKSLNVRGHAEEFARRRVGLHGGTERKSG